jgi:drug/metabolite transporter (DMT)-like permease
MPFSVIAEFVALAALWGASFLFTRLSVGEFGALPTAFVRIAIAAAVLLPPILVRGLWPHLRRHWKATFVIGAFNSGIPFALYAFALQSISTGLSAILNATAPMFGALVAWLWFNERPNASRALGLVIGFAGVALLAGEKASFAAVAGGIAPGWGMLACLAACLCYGLGASASKRYIAGVPPLVAATGSQLGAALALAAPAFFVRPPQMPGAGAWAAVAALGVLCTALAYALYFRLIERAGPARTLTVTFLIPVFAVLYGAVFLGESITPWMLACGAVVVLGTALSTGFIALPRLRPQTR